MNLGWPLPKRKHHLQEILENKPINSFSLKFQGRMRSFGVHAVPLELPKYRLGNGRTQAAQEEYVASHPGKGEDFFSRDQELEEAQRIQHTILRKMLSDKQTNLLGFFKRTKQEEPLILTDLGFVVNGNRRLCAMRELYEQDKAKFRHFMHIEVVVLPHCDHKDIDELEADLQIKTDIKADYTWIAMACMLRKRENQYSEQLLAQMYDMKPKDVKKNLDLLAYADKYLSDIGSPRQYELVKDSFYAFEKIRVERPKIRDEGEKQVFDQIAYYLIQNPKGQGRLYTRIPEVRLKLAKIITELQQEFPETTPKQTPKDKKGDLLGPARNPLGSLAKQISNVTNRAKVLDIVEDVIESDAAKQREQRKVSFAKNQLVRASTMLREALNSLDKQSLTDGMEVQLREIDVTLISIRKWLGKNA